MTDRPVHTDALKTLGTIIGPEETRDAIHLAVFPAIAAHSLRPSQDVEIGSDGYARIGGKPVGIVDPFLTADLKPGDRFWLIVYPRQITSLRHVWEHAAFPSSAANLGPAANSSYSERWMREWAAKHMSEDYYGDDDSKHDGETSYQLAIDAGRENHVGPYEDARDHIDSAWWDHWEAITGVKGKRDEYFSCGC